MTEMAKVSTQTVVVILKFLAGLLVFAGLQLAILVLVDANMSGGRIQLMDFIRATLCVVGGVSIGALLWAASWMIRCQTLLPREQVIAAPDAPTAAPVPAAVSAPAALTPPTPTLAAEPAPAPETVPAQPPAAPAPVAEAPAVPAPKPEPEFKPVLLRDEETESLYKEILQHVAARHWQQALGSARALLDLGRPSPQAEEVSASLAAIEQNARTEEIRELRVRIRDLMAARQYGDALVLAEDMMKRIAKDDLPEEILAKVEQLRSLVKTADQEVALR